MSASGRPFKLKVKERRFGKMLIEVKLGVLEIRETRFKYHNMLSY